MKVKEKKCRAENCENHFKPVLSTDKFCSYTCAKKSQKVNEKPRNKPKSKPISNMSEKRKKETSIYLKKRIEFLNKDENKFCQITGMPTTEIHHKMGRVGYADQWARDDGITLLLDDRYFMAVSRMGHNWIHDNDAESRKLGYLLSSNA